MSSEPARSPRETSHYLSTQMLAKAHNPWGKSFLLAVAAGVMIGLGYVFYITTQQGAANADWLGEAKLLGGVAFSVGLILVVMTGADLFTSTTMTVVPLAKRQIAPARFFAHWRSRSPPGSLPPGRICRAGARGVQPRSRRRWRRSRTRCRRRFSSAFSVTSWCA